MLTRRCALFLCILRLASCAVSFSGELRTQLRETHVIGASGSDVGEDPKNDSQHLFVPTVRQAKIFRKTVAHQKTPGNGYKIGSPLYAKQQAQHEPQNNWMLAILDWWIWLCVLALVIVCWFLMSKLVGRFIRKAIEELDVKLIGAEITIGYMSVHMLEGVVRMRDVVVYNPVNRGFKSDHFLRIKEVYIDMRMTKFVMSGFVDTIVDELVLDTCDAIVEYKGLFGGESNANDIQQAIDALSAPAPSSASVPSTPAPPAAPLIVHRVHIKAFSAKVQTRIMGASVPLDDIMYEDMSKVSGANSVGDVVGEILKSMARALKQNVKPGKH